MARIVIVGSGVVGTATGKGFARHGHQVTFVDVNPERLRALGSEGYAATDGIDLAGEPSFVFLTLATPSGARGYDLSAFAAGTTAVGEALRTSDAFHTVVVRSTVPPGTTEGLVRELLERASGKVVDESFGLAANPEFLRAASALEDFLWPWMTVIGARSRRTVERVEELLRPFGGEIRTFANPAEAELVKCAHNLFNATKISFWNEMWRVSTHLGLRADEIAATVARSAEGSTNPAYGIRGGAPFGGACLPKDVKGFVGFAEELGVPAVLASAVLDVNTDMAAVVSRELQEACVHVEELAEPPVIDLSAAGDDVAMDSRAP